MSSLKKTNQCEECGKEYSRTKDRWCKPCQKNYLKNNFTSSGNEKIDNFIKEMQSKINNPNDNVFEWIPYYQFRDIKEIGKGGFATVYLTTWIDGPLSYKNSNWKRSSYKKVALKCLNNSQNITNEFLNEVKAYSLAKLGSNILKIYGISQNPDTNDYVMILEYAKDGNFNDWMHNSYRRFTWTSKMKVLSSIINGFKEIHQKQMVHRDIHTGNILFVGNVPFISDMGLCEKVGIDESDKSKVYGVMPYKAPEVLKGYLYTQGADIYSFGMIMYFAATGKQPFADRAHDQYLALDICNGIRPKINKLEAPKCYIDLMEKCWNSNLDNRPNAIEIYNLLSRWKKQSIKYGKFQREEKYRKENLLSIENNHSIIHTQVIYTSRILVPYTKNLQDVKSECIDCEITD